MPIHALEDLDDAFDATRALLWPIDRSRWIKLALVVLFVGGPGASLNTFQYNVPVDGGAPPGGFPTLGEIDPGTWLAVGAAVGVAVLLALLLLLVSSVMEFVLVESLRTEEVLVRNYWSEYWRQGVRLFGFRLVVGLLVFGSAAVLAALFVVPAVVGGPGIGPPAGGLGVLAALLLLPVFLVLALVVGLVSGFTTAFVVPIMLLEDVGVLDGWRRLWPTVTAHPWQYLAYAVAGFVLTAVLGVLAAVAVGLAALVLLIPFGILAAIGFLLLMAVPPVGLGVLAVVAVLFGLSMLVVVALAQVPVVTYLRYYALFVLGDVDEGLDLIPTQRAAARADEEPDAPPV